MAESATAVPSIDQQIENAREDAQRLAGTGWLTEKQALAYCLRSVYGFERQKTATIMETDPSNLDNIYRRAKQNVDNASTIARTVSNDTRPLQADIGGEVQQTIEYLDGKHFLCGGCNDIHELTPHVFSGYPHSDGLADGRGRQWWLIVDCPKTTYQNSWQTVRHNLIDDADIREVQVVIKNDAETQTLSLTITDVETDDEIWQDDLEYSQFAEPIETVRTPPHTVTAYDFRDTRPIRGFIGGQWDALPGDEHWPPTFTITVEDDNEARKPFEQTYSFEDLGMKPTPPESSEETAQ